MTTALVYLRVNYQARNWQECTKIWSK